VLHTLALVFAAIAVGCMVVAVAGMVTDKQSTRTGVLVRLAALLCFALAVVLNVVAH
jgi:drug/metabolite transporter (DMT)-like permease